MTYGVGQLIPGGRYRILKVLGTGGMATVYEVVDLHESRPCVAKVLHAELDDRRSFAERIALEARTLARLDHPNIVKVFRDHVTPDDERIPFVIMERLVGKDLRTVIESRGKLDAAYVLPIAMDLLHALGYAHNHGVIHRDVKPENVFLHREVSRSGMSNTRVKLLDFGAVGFAGVRVGDKAGGTVRYASPEQLRGSEPASSMDIYAAGLVLYELLAGAGPFDDAEGEEACVQAQLHRVPAPLVGQRGIPNELALWVARALEKDPAQRPPSAAAFADGIAAILA